MEKINLSETLNGYKIVTTKPETVEIDTATYISVAGHGSFTEQIFYSRISVLFEVANALQELFASSEKSYEGAILECLYWYDEKKHGFVGISEIWNKVSLNELNYRLLIRVPEFITVTDVEKVKKDLNTEYNEIAAKVELFEMQEGKCVQALHEGPFENEEYSLNLIEKYVETQGLVKNGYHHEIYLVNFAKEQNKNKYRTILREPVK
ncbi:MAG TPA: GyrI-like domain-containing protein, partial [Chitinophagaceae bacterium]|nr:GyrI-like domain-containing protein [Chitinophagaceae bacterium]